MKMYPIHKNLSTAFVNLTALVQYLRSLQFVGSIHVELSSYEADIAFTKANMLLAREYDHIAGRLSQGDHALQRILIRAKDPCGRIHVFPAAEDKTRENNVFIDESIATVARQMAAGRSDKRAKNIRRSNCVLKPLFPDLFNQKRTQEQEQRISAKEWNELLNLTEELLRTIDESLAKVNINFQEAFQNACGLMSFDYSFLDPDTDGFVYSNGCISIHKPLGMEIFTAGIVKALGRILDRLREEPYFGNVYHSAMHRIRMLINARKAEFDKFGMTPYLEKVFRIQF